MQKQLKQPAAGLNELLARWADYVEARRSFLKFLAVPESNRDPLSELSEQLVAAAVNGRITSNRVQRGWDVLDSEGQRVQVKYLANHWANKWVNEHCIEFPEECDRYALVIFDDYEVSTILVVDRPHLSPLYQALGKRHAGRGTKLNVTLSNIRKLEDESDYFESIGMKIFKIKPTVRSHS